MWNFTKGLLIIALAIFSLSTKAQVGINNDTPDPAAILDIKSDTLGVLFPRIANSSFLDNEKGLFFYATDDDKFYYYNGSDWQCVNPFLSTGTNNARLNGSLEVQGNVSVEPESTISGYGTIPLGGIIMWSGDHTNVPDGWTLCNGAIVNSIQTPDLRGRFVVGYSDGDKNSNDPRYTSYGGKNNAVSLAYQYVGDVGGDTINRLTNDNIPNHIHSMNHGHGITDPGHTHEIRTGRNGGNGQITKQDEDNKAYKNTESSTTGITVNSHTGNTGDWGGAYQAAVYEYDYTGSECKYNITKVGCTDTHPFTNYPDLTANCEGGGYFLPRPFILDPEFGRIPNPDYIAPIDNPNCFKNIPDCEILDYNPNYGDRTLITAAGMGVDPVENRPPYYVIAFIIRVK
jgi:microcystin-dependent protein